MQNSGAVGFMAAQAYDINGNICSPQFNSKVIGVTLEELKKAKNVVAVSGGKRKGAAVLGALRGGFMDVLVTDLQCVQEMVKLDKNTKNKED